MSSDEAKGKRKYYFYIAIEEAHDLFSGNSLEFSKRLYIKISWDEMQDITEFLNITCKKSVKVQYVFLTVQYVYLNIRY